MRPAVRWTLPAATLLPAAALFLASCAGGAPAPPEALPGAGVEALPPIPEGRGPLRVRVEYPDSLQRIAAADSNFLFGSVGSGEATLIIDGHLVAVEPNGAFLAWLPVPPSERGDTAVYRLVARTGEEIDSLRHPILLPRSPFRGEGAVWIDTASLPAAAERWALPEEPLEVALRAAPGARVTLESAVTGAVVAELPELEGPVTAPVAGAGVGAPGVPGGPDAGSGRYAATLAAGELADAACREVERCGRGAEASDLPLRVVAVSGPDTARAEVPLRLRLLDPVGLPVVELRESPDPVNGSDGIVVGRPVPFGPYRWRFPTGSRAEVEARVGDRVRLRLAPGLAAWVSAEDVQLLPAAPRPRSAVGDLSLEPEEGKVILRIRLASALPVHVEEPDDHTLLLTLYGALGNTNRIAHGAGQEVVESVRWEQGPGPTWRLWLRTRSPVWGYRVAYEEEGTRRAVLRFEIHRPPAIDRNRPLRGRRIAIDPGHPGAGAYGPTGYYEGDANLAIGRRLAELLRAEGAAPILIRDDTLPLGLYHRTSIAEDAGAELFVSIHNNALPDGVRPFGREGTSTYYYHPHSRQLAERVQEGMLRTMGLRDLGVYWGDLAVVRMAWMPAVLAEGAFMMHPRHEAALRDPAFQEAYARGVLEGMRAFLRERAVGRPGS